MKLRFKQLDPAAHIPTRGTEHAAGLDLYAIENSPPYGKIKTGIAAEIPEGYFGLLKHRSSSPFKIRLGAIDADYRGELFVQLEGMRDGAGYTEVRPGDRIAQLIVLPYAQLEPEWADEISDTIRGAGGFGSTGK